MTSTEAKKRQQATQQEIKLTETQIRENEAKVRNSLGELNRLSNDITATQLKINSSRSTVEKLEVRMKGLADTIAANETQLEKLRTEYFKAVRKMRLTMKNRSELAFVFSSDNFNQALRRVRYLNQFSRWRQSQAETIAIATASLTNHRSQLEIARTQQATLLKEQELQEQTLRTQKNHQALVVAQLKQNGEALKQHLSKKQAEANALKSRIADLIAAEQRKAEEERIRREQLAREKEAREKEARERETREREAREREAREKRPTPPAKQKPAPKLRESKKTTATASGQGFASMKGKLPLPVSGQFKVTSRFGRQSLPDLPDVVYENPGIDAEATPGASAQAVYAGKVSGVYVLPGYHTVVIVNHGNYYTVYGNLASPGVSVGQEVAAGQKLGVLAPDDDDKNRSAIHFEVWRNRDKLNPLEWLK